jgi:hypothetical protein
VLSRRDFLRGISLVPLAGLIPRAVWERAAAAAIDSVEFFTAHQGAVVREATARILPGPLEDPLELGHPGAREANVVRYVDVLLSALDHQPERVFGGGPYGAAANQFVPLSTAQHAVWARRLADLKKAYRDGVALLDSMAGGDYATAPALQKDSILASAGAASFLDILYTHTLEGTYSDPMYGGNANRSGWTEIKFPGPSQPRGYTADEVSRNDGLDVLVVTDVVEQVLGVLGAMPGGRRASRPEK